FAKFSCVTFLFAFLHAGTTRQRASITSANPRVRVMTQSSGKDQYTPTVVCAATPRHGRTPLTPSHGYFSLGGSRSPSSRSAKRGTKNSFVSVVSNTRPVPPTGTTLS